MKILAIIPARFASNRFPGKPLAIIQGKSMIQRVYEQVRKCTTVNDVIVATDDKRIEEVVKNFGGKVMMTSTSHQSGTERCAEVIQNNHDDYGVVINVQGDEPFILPEQIDMVGKCFSDAEVEIATLVKRIVSDEELFNPNAVKVVIGEHQQALYFSRSAIPHLRGIPVEKWINALAYFKHIGIYGFRTNVLKEIVHLPVNDLEKAELLEQLRWLANGYRIQTATTDIETISIDTVEDLERARKFLNEI